jgi:hypothetical protein
VSDFENSQTRDGFTMKLWRGERMCLLAFDVEQPEDDFVGFAIKVKNPGKSSYYTLRNRISFSYDSADSDAVNGKKKYLSTESPFQKFRWIDFPPDNSRGVFSYRAIKMHMGSDGKVKPGTSVDLDIYLEPETYACPTDASVRVAASQGIHRQACRGAIQSADRFGQFQLPWALHPGQQCSRFPFSRDCRAVRPCFRSHFTAIG